MRRHLVERGREPEQLVRRRPSPNVSTSASRGDARGQRARLVEQQDRRARERLERAAALDDDPALGRRGRCRRRSRSARPGSAGTAWRPRAPTSARTGSPVAAHAPPAITSVTGMNQSAYRSASRTAGACSCSAASTSRTIPAYVLSLGGRGGAQVERRPGVHRAGAHALAARAARPGATHRSARTRRVRRRPPRRRRRARPRPVFTNSRSPERRRRRSAVSGARRPRSDGPAAARARAATTARVRRGVPRTLRAPGPSASITRDHRAGQVLAERERPHDREERDHVDAGLATRERPHDVHDQRQRRRGRWSRPTRASAAARSVRRDTTPRRRQTGDAGEQPEPLEVHGSSPRGAPPGGGSSRSRRSPCRARRSSRPRRCA